MRYLVAYVALALALPHFALAQAFDWRPTNRETATMLRAGNFDAAQPVILDALSHCPQAVTPLEAALCTAIFSENLSSLREHQGNLPAAEAALRQMLAARIGVLPPNDPLIVQAHFFLALFFQRQNRRTEEVAELQAAEALAQTNGQRSDLVGLFTRHAQALDALGRPLDALPLYNAAYQTARDLNGATGRDTLITLGNLFSAQAIVGAADPTIAIISDLLASPDATAIDPEQRALLAGELAQQVTGPARSRAALSFVQAALPDLDNGLVVDPTASFTLLRGAARINTLAGDPAVAVDLARRARQLAATTWGVSSYPVTNALRAEADAEIARHDPQAAIARLTEAAAMLDSPRLALPRAEVEVERSRLLLRTAHRDDAVANDQALIGSATVTDAVPAIQAAVLTLLGEDLVRLAAFETGGKTCARAADMAAANALVSNDDHLRAVLCVGGAAIGQGRPADALDAAQRAQALLHPNGRTGANPAFQIQVAELHAEALRDSGRNNEALAAYKDELALARNSGNLADQGAVMAQIAFVQRQMGLYKDSDDTAAAGLDLLGADGAPRPRANLLNDRAVVAMRQGRPAAAVTFWEASLALRRTDDVTEPLPIATEERDLAAALAATGHNTEAGLHMDVALAGFHALGATGRPYLSAALGRRATIAIAAGDPGRAESALRELLPLQDPASDDAAAARTVLANLLDNQARRPEAASLRAEALSIVVSKHGIHSAEALRVRLSEQASLRDAGRLREAADAARDCADQAAQMPDVLQACLLAQAETALAAGNARDAAASAARAVTEAEIHWTQTNAGLVQALMLQIRATAAMSDTDSLLRLYDRVHALTPESGPSRGWTDVGEGRVLIQSGDPEIGLAMLRLALQQANRLHDPGLAVTATGALAEHALDIGRGRDAIALWEAVLPLVSEDSATYRVTVLEGLGNAANALARYPDAARLFGEAVSLSRTVIGTGSPVYHRLVVSWSEALIHAGKPGPAEDALRLLDADPSPSAQRLHTIGLIHLAQESDDPVAAVMLARQLVAQTEAALGQDSVGAAFARLDLIEIRSAAGKRVDQAELDGAIRVIAAQDPSWRVALRTARLQGLLAAHARRFDDATAAFRRAETIARENQGPDSLAVADELSNQAGVRLRAGDAAAADTLYRQALTMAAPDGDWHNPVWARIAAEAAVAAERTGDVTRAIKLRHDAAGLIPTIGTRDTIRWA